MDSDDRTVGKVLTRREVLRLAGLTGVALAVACGPAAGLATAPEATNAPAPGPAPTETTSSALPACVVRPEMTEGPYFVDEGLLRSDIRSDPATGAVKDGARLDLTVNLSNVGAAGCTPLAGAVVDVWHCDALGVYSDVQDPGFSTVGQKFLRGAQVSDDAGQVRFTTIYPGWYEGRTVHIHFKIRAGNAEFTSQLFFDDAFSDAVFEREPYAGKGERTVRNDSDGIYRNGGEQLTLVVHEAGDGFVATFDIGLEQS